VKRVELDRAVLAWIGEGTSAPADEGRFERLALELFAYQNRHNSAYRRFCDAYGAEPASVRGWRAIPAVPAAAFKEVRLATFPPDEEIATFRTSGSTTDGRGELHLDTLELYEASLRATFGAWICPDVERIRFAVLAPAARDAPDSSLSYMFDVAVRERGTSGSRFWLGPDGWDPDALTDDLRGTREPVALVGTAFAFVHLLDHLASRGESLELPVGSRIMETGGFKGRSREMARDELHASLAERLGLPRFRIVNQYGMCELGSQFYEPSIATGHETTIKRVPPWVRTRAVDPSTLEDVPAGETGILVHYDLANTGSVLAVQTSDLGRIVGEGFEVFGRVVGAELRGCSLAADLMLGGP
jgi:hypothetical protein